MQANPLHLRIGQILENSVRGKENIELLRDLACGGNQHIPLFFTKEKSRETEYCNVDLMVTRNNRIKIIIEIEESNVKPTQICGKFLTSALSHFYINQDGHEKRIEMDSDVAFIQIVNTFGLQDKTQKFKQWRFLEESIRGIIPVKGSSITKYFLLHGDLAYFEQQGNVSILASIIEKALS